MNWYLTKIVFNIDIENGQHNSQFDEQLRIIQAKSRDAAFFKAREIGKQEEIMFLNTNKKEINWRFIDVAEVTRLHELNDGSEIYATTHETKEAKEYISFVKHKAMLIQSECRVFA